MASQRQPVDSSVHHLTTENDGRFTPSRHVYHTVNASDNANLHLGDVHYHINRPDASVKEEILSSLHFRRMFTRYDNIDDPHSDTFQWIFKRPDDEQPRWDSFLDWLNGNGGLYWISGKPGSGKSVLMKYLTSNFKQSLTPDNASVVALSFWFWEAAHTDLERNMLGCLKSLLWQILQHPEHCDAIIIAIKHNLSFEWTKKRLCDAINAALEIMLDANVQVLFFLDGLDECGSDAKEVMDFAINSAKRFAKVKLCVSSRPEPIFQLRLDNYPRLKMQDLNRPDVLAIIEQDLIDAPQFASLPHEQEELDSLKNELVIDAQGVLLWVRIVTRDLLQGIAEGDDFSELRVRLEHLPAELDGEHGLYAYMLRRNATRSKTYLADAALYCQIACHKEHLEFSVLAYCLVSNDDLRHSYLEFREGWETAHHRLDCNRLVRAINARTGGLLEIETFTEMFHDYPDPERAARTRDPTLTKILNRYKHSRVRFIHRTARSYVLETTSGQELLASSHKSISEIEGVMYEARLVSDLILQCLESIAPNGMEVLRELYGYLGPGSSVTRYEKLRSVVDRLAREGYLWLEFYRVRPLPSISHTILHRRYTSLPFLLTDKGHLSDVILFVAASGWGRFPLEHMDVPSDAGLLSCVTCNTLRSEVERHTRTVKTHVTASDSIFSPQPNEIYQVTNSFGEQVTILHDAIMIYSECLSSHDDMNVRGKIPVCGTWMQRTILEMMISKYQPTMTGCNSLFFRWFDETQTFVLDSFNLYCFVGNLPERPFTCREVTIQSHEPSETENTGDTGFRERILCIWPEGAWKPKMYALSREDSQHAAKLHPKIASGETTPEFRMTRRQMSGWAELKARSSEIGCLIDIFRRLGKSETQIAEFIALEDPRIKQMYDEIIYAHWREWFYGIEDPYLEQYRDIPRPGLLHFSVRGEC